jgi:hypothetical protein
MLGTLTPVMNMPVTTIPMIMQTTIITITPMMLVRPRKSPSAHSS